MLLGECKSVNIACPADAVAGIKAITDYIAPHHGGHGAVRDIREALLRLFNLQEK
jgi:3-deoxy-D-manno-octulosonate 8-phosphate phosphatase KdsC-like HAD superfamily phosphatase